MIDAKRLSDDVQFRAAFFIQQEKLRPTTLADEDGNDFEIISPPPGPDISGIFGCDDALSTLCVMI